jgi:hypothetical protein
MTTLRSVSCCGVEGGKNVADFPTLSAIPSYIGWEEQLASDPTIRSKSEGGYTKTRARYTRIPMQWKFQYVGLSDAEKVTLQAFERVTVKCGADSFTWINPIDNVSRTVRFKEAIKFIPMWPGPLWEATMTLEEV